jgi:uncharacterized repeat protein (TIGR01451 family)
MRKGIGLAVLLAGLGTLPGALPGWGDSCRSLPVSSAGQLGCSVDLHAGAQPALALGANLGGDRHTGSVTVCLGEVECEAPLAPADGQAGDEFGRSVAIDDDWLAVGAPFANGSGVVYLYRRDGGSFTAPRKLLASDAARGDQFGLTLALSGDTLIVGAPNAVGHGGSLSGVVYVFHREGETWTQAQELTADDARPFDNFGFSLAIDASRAVIGAPFHDGAAGNSGAAYVFEKSGDVWSQRARLPVSGGAADDEFGSAVAVTGPAVAVGARAADVGGLRDAGAAYVYEGSGGAWSEVARFAGQAAGDRFGVAVAMSGGTQLVVGALLHGGTGAAYLYERQPSGWAQDGAPRLGDAPGDRFGQAVSADGGQALVGAYLARGSAAQVCNFSQPPKTPSADVGLTVTAPASTQPGRTLVQTLTVTNHGPDPATGVHVQEDVPAGLELVPARLPTGCTVATGTAGTTGTIDCALRDLAVRDSTGLSLTFAVLESCVPVILGVPAVSAKEVDPERSNNSAKASTVLVRKADLAIAQTSPPFVTPGAPIPAVLTVTDRGPDLACGVVVSDPIPAGQTAPELPGDGSCSIVRNEIRCLVGELADGASRSFTIGFKAPPSPGCGRAVVNTVSVSAVPPADDPRPLNNSRSVTTAIASDLSITKKVDRAIAGANQPLVYTIVVGNPDGCAATVQDDFPAALTQARWCRDEAGPCIPSIPGHLLDRVTGAATYRVQGFVEPGFVGKLANTATVEGPPGAVDPVLANNAATASTEVVLEDQEIPTLSGSALAALALLLTLLALRRLRRRSL